jgi:hypothetical protein
MVLCVGGTPLFWYQSSCDLVILIGPECVDAMSVELSCRHQVQMRCQSKY